MNLPSFIASATGQANLWKDLTHSVPTLAALAQLASDRLVSPNTVEIALSPEANTILSITRDRGVIELKSNKPSLNLLNACWLSMLSNQQIHM